MNKACVLVDGSSYLFRAFYALPPLTNSQGFPTGAIFGVINMLIKLLDQQPQHMAVIFDTPTKNFRHQLYPEYKANRDSPPSELIQQIEPLKELISALGIPCFALVGFEADDVIGVLAKQAEKRGLQVLISSGDKDFAQLVTDNVVLENTMQQKIFNPSAIKEKYGVGPEQFRDYLALVGDSIDNVPGVKGVGPKTAVKWLNNYGSIEKLLESKDSITGKVGERLRESVVWLETAKKLVTIATDIKIDIALDDCILQPIFWEQASTLFTTYALKHLEKRLRDSRCLSESVTSQANNHYQLLNQEDAEAYLTAITADDVLTIDTETTGLDWQKDQIIGLAMQKNQEVPVYLPFRHQSVANLSIEKLMPLLKKVLENTAIAKQGHNLKFDWHMLYNEGLVLQGIMHDTILQSYILHSTENHSLDALSLKYLQKNKTSFEELVANVPGREFSAVPLAEAAAYACDDVYATALLSEKLQKILSELTDCQKLYNDIELPLLEILAKMERKGICIDIEQLNKLSTSFESRMDALQESAYVMVGRSFNLNSPNQLKNILFEEFGLPVLEKTASGQPSTAESVLQALAHMHALPRLLTEYRQLAKLKSTYTDRLPHLVMSETGRLHTAFNQTVTTTGRLSSTHPNIQNIPIRTEDGRLIRKAFYAEAGNLFLSCDYSQIELRIMAHLSKDTALCEAFANKQDVHARTALEIFDIAADDLTADHRRIAKAINFGLMYGMSAFGLSRHLGLAVEDARKYIERYFERFSGVKRYIEEVRQLAEEKGYVETVLGRRLYLPDMRSSIQAKRRAALRAAINAPMQGTAADIIKKAMIAVEREIGALYPNINMLLQIHDELVFEIPEHDINTFAPKVKDLMETALELRVPLVVNQSIGKTLGDLEAM